MEPLSCGRRVPLDEVLSDLKCEFDDAEWEYNQAHQETTSEDDLEDNRGEGSDEEKGGDTVSAHPVLKTIGGSKSSLALRISVSRARLSRS